MLDVLNVICWIRVGEADMLHVGERLVRCIRVGESIRFRGSLKRIAIKLSQTDSLLPVVYF